MYISYNLSFLSTFQSLHILERDSITGLYTRMGAQCTDGFPHYAIPPLRSAPDLKSRKQKKLAMHKYSVGKSRVFQKFH